MHNLISLNYIKPITLASLADECGVSKQYAMRLFKKYYNVTVTRYINNYKLQKAKNC